MFKRVPKIIGNLKLPGPLFHKIWINKQIKIMRKGNCQGKNWVHNLCYNLYWQILTYYIWFSYLILSLCDDRIILSYCHLTWSVFFLCFENSAARDYLTFWKCMLSYCFMYWLEDWCKALLFWLLQFYDLKKWLISKPIFWFKKLTKHLWISNSLLLQLNIFK